VNFAGFDGQVHAFEDVAATGGGDAGVKVFDFKQ
jgi:hypothetical protein